METITIAKKDILQIIKIAGPKTKAKIKEAIGDQMDPKQIKNYKEITSHEIACQVLGRDTGTIPNFSLRPKKDRAGLIALIQLIDIAEAINLVDGFTPDWKNTNQYKWRPWFDGTVGFAFSYSFCDAWHTHSYVGSRLCFRTEEISNYFGKQFQELHQLTLNQ